jgi:hypothetical protein
MRLAFRGLLYWRNIIFCVGLVFLLLDEASINQTKVLTARIVIVASDVTL